MLLFGEFGLFIVKLFSEEEEEEKEEKEEEEEEEEEEENSALNSEKDKNFYNNANVCWLSCVFSGSPSGGAAQWW